MEQVHLFLACYPFYVQLEYKELYIRHERSMYDLLCAGCWNPVCAEFYLHTPCAIRRAPLPSLTSNISHPAFTPHPASHIPHPTSHIPHSTSHIPHPSHTPHPPHIPHLCRIPHPTPNLSPQTSPRIREAAFESGPEGRGQRLRLCHRRMRGGVRWRREAVAAVSDARTNGS